ncbi:SDR family NAD(P)-dependent oxidoreductase [Neorhizobium sp. T25_27]|uniref:SDR family NAD(P)-dependent oxidoreductase n=1 Tax=Neorhizobium sp. T25_27 TaxID=2093831 RepID=UPI000CF83FC3|nr:SDR family NAD(P)-dependent oxidoreductase [Neorhizobium sp. T25_27]
MKKTWMVTGCAGGLGRALAELVLARGDRVLATSRDISRLQELKQRFGDRVELFELDVTSPAACQAAIEKAVTVFGRLDVLVNNTGYARVGPFEQAAANDFNAEIDTNFFGVVNTTRAALPLLRKQRSGYVINISSSAGRIAAAGTVAYCAAKFAVSGFSEALAKEVGAFGVKVISIEPGSLRTNWTSAALATTPHLEPDYEPVLGANVQFGKTIVGREPGDPRKCAAVIFDLSRKDELPHHLILGSDAVKRIEAGDRDRSIDAEKWRVVSESTDFQD